MKGDPVHSVVLNAGVPLVTWECSCGEKWTPPPDCPKDLASQMRLAVRTSMEHSGVLV